MTASRVGLIRESLIEATTAAEGMDSAMTHDSPASSANRTRAQHLLSGVFTALFLLGLVTLSGCQDRDWPASSQLRSLEITPTNPSVAAGTSVQLTATGIYSDNSHADLTAQVSWVTSNTAVATVAASTGKALGVVPGTATLSASLHGLTATTRLTVTSATLVSVAITPPIASLAAGTSEQLTATGTFSDNTTQDLTAGLTWASSDTTVATVSKQRAGQHRGPRQCHDQRDLQGGQHLWHPRGQRHNYRHPGNIGGHCDHAGRREHRPRHE